MPEYARFADCLSEEGPTPHQRRLDAIEKALVSAGREAASLDDPVLDYFIEMALAEVRAKSDAADRAAFPSRSSKPLRSFG